MAAGIKTSITKWMLLLCTTILLFTKSASTSEARVVCYYTNWSVYRPGTARFNPQNINPYLCTHLIYAFGGFTKDNTLKPFDKYQDIEQGGYAKFTGLKTYNKDLKTMLAIGGWNEGSSRFSPMVASKQRRKEFVKNSIKFLRQNRFDGLDLDWEYPAFRDGGKPKDRDNYARLVHELRDEFEREANKTGRARLLLTMAVPAGIEYIQKGYDVPKLNQYLDWFNILSYDYHSAFEPSVNHHSPLYPLEEPSEYSVDGELNIDYTIKFYLENGAEPDKLVLGIPTYGRSFTLFNADARELGAPADGPGEQGDATREKGYLAYYEICEYIKSPQKTVKKTKRTDDDDEEEADLSEEEEVEPWTVVQPAPDAMGPYAVRGNQWVGYDDVDIVRKKAEYVADKGLGGIMFWSIDNDDFRGTCHNKPYPLIEAAKEALIAKLGITDNAISSDKQTSTSVLSRNKSRGNAAAKISSSTARTISRQNKKAITATTPVWSIRTPEPPTTPDPGSDFKCEEEGFFDHPRDCKKYFWCLDSGPSNLGIVAHQFTCPSGLFFNKAADSCDFARNVFCKKDKATTSTTTTPAPTPTANPRATTARTTTSRATTDSATTKRSVSKLSSKSSLFFRSTTSTTTQTSVKDEQEYEDDDGYDLTKGLLDTEEDPKVIKELISLIRKAGGVDQLEKQLNLGEDQSAATAAPTAAIPKKLYERVLSNTRSTTFNTKIDDNAPGYNSRLGPQNAGLEKTQELNSIRKDRPKYTTINRTRPPTSTTEAPESDVEDEEGVEEGDEEDTPAFVSKVAESYTQKPFMPHYVNIKRNKPITTETSPDLADNSATRNALHERNESVLDTRINGAIQSILETGNKRESLIPDYVSIRREKPNNAPEESNSSNGATSKYQTIVRTRGTTTETLVVEEQKPSSPSTLSVEKPNEVGYVTIQRTRGTTTPTPTTATPLHDNDVTVSYRSTESYPTTPEKVATVSLGTPTTTFLNTQITTLLNTAASSEVKETAYLADPSTEAASPSLDIHITKAASTTTLSTTTTTTTAEVPPSTTARVTVLKKRTRPTTTFTPTEATTTTTVKVSGEKKYAFIRRTRPAKVSTDATVENSNLFDKNNYQNEILSNVEKNILASETVGATSFRSANRKIRSTTPNSRELGEEDDANNYGSKITDPTRRRPANRRRNDTSSKIESNGENGYVTRNNSAISVSNDDTITLAPRVNRFRNDKRKKIVEAINYDEVRESTITNDNINTRQRNRFRPNQAKKDLLSLTSVEKTSEPRFIPRSRSAQGNTRNTFKPRGTTERSAVLDDSVNSDSSVTEIIRPRPTFITRGRSRFTTERTTLLVNGDAKVTREDRKSNIARFTPRPFSRFSFSTTSDLYDSDDGITKREENVLALTSNTNGGTDDLDIKVNETTLPPLSVTKVINTNILLGQSNNRSSLRRTQTRSTTESQFEDEFDPKNEDIHLSASEHLEESEEEHQGDHQLSTPSEKPRKKIIVKKLRPIKQIDEIAANFAIGSNSRNTKNELDTTNSENIKDEKTKQRRVKIIRRRPAASLVTETSAAEPGFGITQNARPNEFQITENQNTQSNSSVSRIRKIIRKKILPTAAKVENTTYMDDTPPTENSTEEVSNDITYVEPVIPTTEQLTTITSTEVSTSTSTTEEATILTSPPSPTTLRSRFERPLYRPTKRTINVGLTTETPSSSIRTFSRKYKTGAYTSPQTPNRDSSVIQPTRKKLFGSRPFSRKPVTTARTTTKLDEEEEEVNYSEEYEEEEEIAPESSLVLVPDNKLFTRAPKHTDLPKVKYGEEETIDEYDNEYEDENVEHQETSEREPSSRPPFVSKPTSKNSFRSTISPEAIYKIRPANKTRQFNRPLESKRSENKPIGYAPNKTSTDNIFSTETPISKELEESIKEKHKLLFSKSKVNKIGKNLQNSSIDDKKSTESILFGEVSQNDVDDYLSTTDEIDNADDAYSSTIDSFTVSETSTGYSNEQYTTIVTEDISLMPTTIDDFEFTTKTNTFELQRDERVTIDDYINTTDGINIDKIDTTTEVPSTASHHIFSVTDNDMPNGQMKDTSSETLKNNYTTLAPTTESSLNEMSVTEYEPIVKTQFDRLFSVSRLVEISSKQDKHRINKNNESILIETGNIKQERKPKLDKIGEVNRFTLIKIVKDDIPIYLTKLGHVYPVDNPPNNYIRIDEARNAKSLKKFSDSGKENLIASESINEAYRHVNKIRENSNLIPNKKDNKDNKTTISNTDIKTTESPATLEKTSDTYPSISSQWNFYPAAYDNDKLKSKIYQFGRSLDIITPRSYSTEPSTLALEGLFKTEYPSVQSARKVPENKVMERIKSYQPFVVYAAPRSPNVNIETRDEVLAIEEGSDKANKSFANFVKLEVLKPEVGRSVKTYAKGQEFSGVLHEVSTIKYPISISIISSDGNPVNETELQKQDSTQMEKKTTEMYSPSEINTEVNFSPVTSDTQTTSASTTKAPLLLSTIKITVDNYMTTTDTTETPAESSIETTTSRIQLVSGGLTNAAKKRPKLNFPRRLQPKNSDITRISVSPLASSATTPRPFKTTISSFNLSTVKFNRNGNFTSKSRFSSNRSQNIPVDNRKSQNQANNRPFRKQNSTEVVRIQAATSESPRKINFKPIRPNFLRNSQFRKSSTTPAPQTSTTGKRRNFINRRTRPNSATAASTSSANDVTTETSRTSDESQPPAKNSFRRRGSSKFEPKEKRPQDSNTDKGQPTEIPDDTLHRFGGNSRRPSFKPSNTREKQNNTEALSTSTNSPNGRGRPTRTFVRPRRRFTKQSEGGDDASTTTPSKSTTTPATRTTDATSRKPFRVGVRRRNPVSSTTVTESTKDSSSGNDLAGQESVEKAKSDEEFRTSPTTTTETSTTSVTSASSKKELIRKTVKIQRRPLTSVKTRQSQVTTDETPTTTGSSGEKKRDSKKYSASFKQNQLDEMLRNQASTEKVLLYASTESIEELSADTAIAIAAHQLLGAPLPSTAGYEKEAGTEEDLSRSSPSPAIVTRSSSTYFSRTSPSPTTISLSSLGATTLEELEQGLHLTRDYLMESPVTGAFDPDFQYLTPLSSTARTTQNSRKRVTQPFRKISTTIPPPTQPTLVLTSPFTITARRRPDKVKAFDKIKPQAQGTARTYRPVIDYEYYDDTDDKILDKFLGSSQNVLLDSRGIIECLDIGNFPHPSSCKKFISCARDGRSGAIYGWEYFCPSGLSYDPVGGICNWSAGLGCNES